jgi:hypothetical protein
MNIGVFSLKLTRRYTVETCQNGHHVALYCSMTTYARAVIDENELSRISRIFFDREISASR